MVPIPEFKKKLPHPGFFFPSHHFCGSMALQLNGSEGLRNCISSQWLFASFSWEAPSKAVLHSHNQHSNRSENSMLLLHFPALYSTAFCHQWAGYKQLRPAGKSAKILPLIHWQEKKKLQKQGMAIWSWPTAKHKTQLQAPSPMPTLFIELYQFQILTHNTDYLQR